MMQVQLWSSDTLVQSAHKTSQKKITGTIKPGLTLTYSRSVKEWIADEAAVEIKEVWFEVKSMMRFLKSLLLLPPGLPNLYTGVFPHHKWGVLVDIVDLS